MIKKVNYISELEKQLSRLDSQGAVVVQPSLLATLYFENGHLPEVRTIISGCFEEYLTLYGQYLHWAAHPQNFSWKKLAKHSVPTPKEWFQSQSVDETDTWEFDYHGGKVSYEASSFFIRAVGTDKLRSERRGRLSYLSFSLPLTLIPEQLQGFSKLVLKWSGQLCPLHGYGGIGISESPEYEIAQDYHGQVYGMAGRFPGLEVDYPDVHVLYLKTGIKGGSWLTVLNDSWLITLGGQTALERQLGEGFKFYPYPGGMVIQAGTQPEIGDTNRKLEPEYYRKLAQVLKPIRVKEHGRFHGSAGFDFERTLTWLARFD